MSKCVLIIDKGIQSEGLSKLDLLEKSLMMLLKPFQITASRPSPTPKYASPDHRTPHLINEPGNDVVHTT